MTNKENNIAPSVVIALVILLAISGFSMMGFGGIGGMMGNWNYGFGGMWIFGFLFMTLILVALVLFILWLSKQLQSDNNKRR